VRASEQDNVSPLAPLDLRRRGQVKVDPDTRRIARVGGGRCRRSWSVTQAATDSRSARWRRADLRGGSAGLRNFDALTFNAWFTAYVVGNKNAMQVAERRFRPQFLVAFNAWLATHAFTNPFC
jgi:hypothetical protein